MNQDTGRGLIMIWWSIVSPELIAVMDVCTQLFLRRFTHNHLSICCGRLKESQCLGTMNICFPSFRSNRSFISINLNFLILPDVAPLQLCTTTTGIFLTLLSIFMLTLNRTFSWGPALSSTKPRVTLHQAAQSGRITNTVDMSAVHEDIYVYSVCITYCYRNDPTSP